MPGVRALWSRGTARRGGESLNQSFKCSCLICLTDFSVCV